MLQSHLISHSYYTSVVIICLSHILTTSGQLEVRSKVMLSAYNAWNASTIVVVNQVNKTDLGSIPSAVCNVHLASQIVGAARRSESVIVSVSSDNKVTSPPIYSIYLLEANITSP